MAKSWWPIWRSTVAWGVNVKPPQVFLSQTCGIIDNATIQSSQKCNRPVCLQSAPHESSHISLVVDTKLVISPPSFAGFCGRSILLSLKIRWATWRSCDSRQADSTTIPQWHQDRPCDFRPFFLPDWFQASTILFALANKVWRKITHAMSQHLILPHAVPSATEQQCLQKAYSFGFT